MSAIITCSSTSTTLLDPKEPIPTDKKHLHFGAGQTEARLDLPLGKHTLQLVLGDAEHRLFQPAPDVEEDHDHGGAATAAQGAGEARGAVAAARRPQPRPTNGILVAITVRNCTFASSGRLAM